MTLKNSKIIALTSGAAIAIAILLLLFGVAQANPSSFTSRAKTSTATTSPTFMTPGTATSTVVYDSFNANGTNQVNNGSDGASADSATLLVQFNASSTSSQLNIQFEYSDDGIDWYQDTISDPNGYATTTLPISLNQIPQYQWKFSSTTAAIGGVTPTTTNTFDTRAINIKTPVRFVRSIITCNIGGLNCAVWVTFIPKKEVNNR